MSLFGSLFGKSGRVQQYPTTTPEQQGLQSQILAQLPQLIGQLQTGAKPFDFGPIEQRARTQFREETIPSLAERFTSMGAGGQRSSAFESALGRAGAGLEQGLAGLRADIGLQEGGRQQQNLLSLLGLLGGIGMRPSFESGYSPGQVGILPQITGSGLNVLLGLLGQRLAKRGGI